jgi:type I restriction enzyme, S subunit
MRAELSLVPISRWPMRPVWALVASREEFGGDLPLLSMSAEYGVRARPEGEGRAASEDLSGYRVVREGDLVINRLSARDGAYGVSQQSGLISPAYWVFRANPLVDPRWLDYVLRSNSYKSELSRISKYMPPAQFDLPWDQFRRLFIPVPPIGDQRRLADYLDTETARIDALIEKKQRIMELLSEKLFVTTRTTMLRLADQYGSIQLRHLVTCLDGRRVPLSAEERGQRGGEYPYFGASSIVDWIDDYLFDETIVLLGEDGAQLAEPMYQIAQVVRGKAWVNNHAHVLRPVSVNPEFLVYLLNTFDRTPYISGGLREKITQDDMNRIPVPNAPQEVQVIEATHLNELQNRCDVARRVLKKQILVLQERRQSLITRAVSGELQIGGIPA